MSAIVEWSAPFTLTSPLGDLHLSADTGYRFLVDQCNAGTGVVTVKKQISGGDGEIFSRRFKTGYTAAIALQLEDAGGPAIGTTLDTMYELLAAHLDALFNPSLDDLLSSCKLVWTPTGSEVSWMLDRIRCYDRPTPAGVLPKVVTFTLDTELPYALRADDTSTDLTDGDEITLDNSQATAARSFPVFQVDGPTDAFTIVNADALDPNGNPYQIVFVGDSNPGGAAIGGGDYVEISCLRETVVLNGDESFASIAGIDIPNSDLRLPLVPGDNRITLTGAGGRIIWAPARA